MFGLDEKNSYAFIMTPTTKIWILKTEKQWQL